MSNEIENDNVTMKAIKDEVNGRVLEAIRTILQGKKIQKKDLARECGVSSAALAEMQSGHQRANMATIVTLCERFNVSAEWMVTGQGEVFKEGEPDMMKPWHNVSKRDIKDVVNGRALEAIKTVAEIRGIKMRRLTSECGLSHSTVKESLKGRQRVSMAVIATFCKVYKVSAEWMLTGRGNMFKDKAEGKAAGSAAEAAAGNASLQQINELFAVMERREKAMEEFLKEAKSLVQQLNAFVQQAAKKAK